MPDLDHLRIDGTTYDLKDSTAREKDAVQDNELDSLKSAIDEITTNEYVAPDNWLNPQNINSGYYWTNGWSESSSYSNTLYIPVEEGKTYYLWTDANTGTFRKESMRFIVGYDENKDYVSSSEAGAVNSYTVPSGVKYIIISAVPAYLTSHGMVTTNGTDATYSAYFDPYYNFEIKMEKVDAYTKEEIDALKFPELFSELEISPSENLYNKATSTDGYISANGSVSSSDTYCYSAKIPVKVGETYFFWALYNGEVISATARFLCAYDSENNPISTAGSNSAISNYTVPDGISAIVISFEQNRRDLFIVTDNSTQPDQLLPYNIEHYIAKESFIQKAFSDLIRGDEFLSMEVATATASQEYDLVDHIDNKKNCAYSFFGRFSAFTSLQIGHGKTESGACYMIIDGTNLTTYNSSGAVYTQTPHGLAMSDFISVSIKEADTKTARASVEIITNGGSVLLTNIIFFGCNGKVHFICGQMTTDVKFVYNIMDLRKDVFVFGDSYTSLADDKRWPEYAIANNDNNILISGFAGARSEDEYPSFENITSMKKPKYVCWFLGMNDPDASGQIAADWLINVSKVKSFCDGNGITLILATIPNTPIVRNVEKNAWVKASGLRYVDFAKAVGAESAGSTWYTGMLSNDNVHPTAEGAKALWLRLRMDVPEIMQPTTT